MKKIINLIILMILFMSFYGCQKATEIIVECNDQKIHYINEKKDDFSDLMESRIKVKHGDNVHINIINDNVKITEYILNEDGTHKYTKGSEIKILEGENVSFQVSFHMFDLFSSQKLEADDLSIRGYVVEYDDKVMMFVLETNVGDFEKETKK